MVPLPTPQVQQILHRRLPNRGLTMPGTMGRCRGPVAPRPRRSARMTHFCSDTVTPPRAPRLRPQAEGREGDIIPAEGGLLGSGFVSKVGSFLASAEEMTVARGSEMKAQIEPLVETDCR